MTWKANIAVKCNGKLAQNHWDEVKSWPEIEKIWSTTGETDFWVGLNNKVKNTDELEKFVFKLRQQPWVNSTSTRWWKEL